MINTAGFLATTNDISNADFMAGRLQLQHPGPAGRLDRQPRHASPRRSGGFAALVAPGVRNSGTITATLGTVALAAGNSFTLDFYGDKLITLAVNDQIARQVIDVATGQPLNSLVRTTASSEPTAAGSSSPRRRRAVVDSVINTSGVIEANSIGHRNGMIVLGAATGGEQAGGRAGADREGLRHAVGGGQDARAPRAAPSW